MITDFLIIGQGISGTCFAWKLLENKLNFKIIDNHNQKASSKIAAGMINPIIGRNFSLSNDYKHQFQTAKLFYESINSVTDSFKEKNILKIITDKKANIKFIKKLKTSKYNEIASKSNLEYPFIKKEHNSYIIKNAAHLNSRKFIYNSHLYFNKKNNTIDENFKNQDLIKNKDHFEYKSKKYKYILDTRGLKIDNDILSKKIFRPAKGEILKIKIKNFKIDYLINSGIFLIPLEFEHFLLGATYNWENLDYETSNKGKTELINKFNELFNLDFEIITQYASIRPIIKGRSPVIGEVFKNYFIINGLASKGVLFAPTLVNNLFDYIFNKISIKDIYSLPKRLNEFT